MPRWHDAVKTRGLDTVSGVNSTTIMGYIMEENTNNNSNMNDSGSRLMAWTREGMDTVTGTWDEVGPQWVAAGMVGSLNPVEVVPPAIEMPVVNRTAEEWQRERVAQEEQREPAPSLAESVASVIEVVEPDMAERRLAAAGRRDWTCEVHHEDAASAQADADMLKAMGLTPGRTYFAPGTPLVQWGVDRWKAQGRELYGQPLLKDQADAIADAVAAERRGDVEVKAADLRMEVDGGGITVTRGGGGLRLERHGLERLCAGFPGMLPRRAYLKTMEAEEIADLWNSRAARGMLDDAPNRVLRYRDAVDGNGRSLYAVVSDAYGRCDVDATARILAETLPGSARGTLVYDPERVGLTWEVAAMGDVPPVVGEVWKVGLKGSTRDDASGSVKGGGMFWRALCCNLTTEELAAELMSQRHRGDDAAMVEKSRTRLAAQWAAVGPAVERFSDRWGRLKSTKATDVIGGEDVRDAIALLVKGDTDLVKAAGVERDALVQMLLQGHAHEPGETLADVVNAVTRLHEAKLPAANLAAVEEHAGMLARNWAGDIVAVA